MRVAGPPWSTFQQSPSGSTSSPREGVAVVRLAGLETARQPVLALRRRAVRPLLGSDRAGGALLLEVAADHGGRPQRVLEVGPRELVALVGGVLPDAGEAVGLELEAYRARVRAGRVALV